MTSLDTATSSLSEPADHVDRDPASASLGPSPARARWWRFTGVAAAIVAGLLVVFVAGPRLLGAATPHLYAGTVLQQSTPAPSLSDLQFVDGSPVELVAFEGELVLVFFGYTSCPDVCPTTLSVAAQAMSNLSAAEAADVRLIMVSVDPDRDDPAGLQAYVEFFHPSFTGATGTPQDVLEAATQYGIFYDIDEHHDPSTPHDYFVDHTSTLMGIDTDGVLRIVWSPTVTAEEISADLRSLLRS